MVPWQENVQLYELLVARFPTLGARAGYAVALAHTGQIERANAVLDGIDPQRARDFIPFWVARARVARGSEMARHYLTRALELTARAPLRAFLERELASLEE